MCQPSREMGFSALAYPQGLFETRDISQRPTKLKISEIGGNLGRKEKPLTEDELEKWGAVEASCRFGDYGNVVTVYGKGFVKVLSGPFLNKGEVEKLLVISGGTDITKKSAFGRTVGAGFSLGLNLVISPSQRGNLYLKIGTDKTTHSLIQTTPDTKSIKNLNLLVSAGEKVIALRDSSAQKSPEVMSEPANLSEQLTQLANLRQSGTLDDEEFAAAKAKLLGN